MMKNTLFLTVSVSILLHLAVIVNLMKISKTEQSLQHRASAESPVISVALTQAIEQARSPETVVEAPSEQHDLPISPIMVDAAELIVANKEKKTQRKPVTKESNKVAVSKEVIEQQEKMKIEVEKVSTQPQPLESQNGVTSLSEAMGAIGKPAQGFSNVADSGQLSSYSEKLRQEIERNKQHPRRAKSMKIRGVIEVEFHLTVAGEMTSARIVTSSGYEILDNAALAAVEKSRSVGVPPEGFKSPISLKIKFQ